jgi:hypothetical protein
MRPSKARVHQQDWLAWVAMEKSDCRLSKWSVIKSHRVVLSNSQNTNDSGQVTHHSVFKEWKHLFARHEVHKFRKRPQWQAQDNELFLLGME